MKRQLIFTFLAIIILTSFAIAQLPQGFILPQTFTINPNWGNLPTPEPNQKIFGCPYVFPIQIKNIIVYNYNVDNGNLVLDMEFRLHTNGKNSACSVPRQNITVSLFNWENSLESVITTQSENNINTQNINSPVATGTSG